jgi:hypothetical protein
MKKSLRKIKKLPIGNLDVFQNPILWGVNFKGRSLNEVYKFLRSRKYIPTPKTLRELYDIATLQGWRPRI